MNDLLPFSPVPSSKKFARWFGSSKVTGAAGQPLAMFHGSACHFQEFDGDRGFYFSSDAKDAAEYAEDTAKFAAEFVKSPAWCGGPKGDEVEPVLYSVFLSLRRPLELDGENPEHEGKFVSWEFDPSTLPEHDGVIMRYANGKAEVIAFRPEQVWMVGKNGRPFKTDEDFYEPEYAMLDGVVVKLRGV